MTELDTYQGNEVAVPDRMTGASSITAWAQAASDAARLVAPLVRTDFVPQHFRGNVEAATAAVLYGAEAGLSPLQALQGVYVISGRPAMYARTMLAIALSSGHEVWTDELTDSRAVVCARRRGSQHVERVVWTKDRARKAGYTRNAKYESDPQAMLLARAQADAVRRIAPDALLGMAYSVEELEDEAGPATATVQRSGKRTVQRKQAEAPPAPPEPELDEPTPEPLSDSITDAQLRKLHAAFNDAGMDSREVRLAFASSVVDRDLESSKDLTKAEAARVIDRLENPPGEIQLPMNDDGEVA